MNSSDTQATREEELAQRFDRLLFNAGPLSHHNLTVDNAECELIRTALRAASPPAVTADERREIAGAICEAMDDRLSVRPLEGPYPRCPDGSECACWGAADQVLALTALQRQTTK